MSEFHKHSAGEFDYSWEAGRDCGGVDEFYWTDDSGERDTFYVRSEDGKILGMVQGFGSGPDRYYKVMRWGVWGGGEGLFRCIGCYADVDFGKARLRQSVSRNANISNADRYSGRE